MPKPGAARRIPGLDQRAASLTSEILSPQAQRLIESERLLEVAVMGSDQLVSQTGNVNADRKRQSGGGLQGGGEPHQQSQRHWLGDVRRYFWMCAGKSGGRYIHAHFQRAPACSSALAIALPPPALWWPRSAAFHRWGSSPSLKTGEAAALRHSAALADRGLHRGQRDLRLPLRWRDSPSRSSSSRDSRGVAGVASLVL